MFMRYAIRAAAALCNAELGSSWTNKTTKSKTQRRGIGVHVRGGKHVALRVASIANAQLRAAGYEDNVKATCAMQQFGSGRAYVRGIATL
jgi:RNA 3'-terminal phosphate cyclase